MKHTKLIIMGLTTAMTLCGASAVFADDVAETDTDTVIEAVENGETLDMSGLELPEDFVPFDEEHVPDGEYAPENGELKAIEFDEEGNMIFGQRPEGMQGELPEGMNGERPEGMNGERPEGMNGEAPDMSGLELPEDFVPFDEEHVPDGEYAPENGELKAIEFDEEGNMIFGQRPEGMQGELPEGMNGERPEGMNGETPDMSGLELPEDFVPFDESYVPDGTNAPADGELPQMEDGELPELPQGGDMQFSGAPQGDMQFGGAQQGGMQFGGAQQGGMQFGGRTSGR